jgi:hypothetical protein
MLCEIHWQSNPVIQILYKPSTHMRNTSSWKASTLRLSPLNVSGAASMTKHATKSVALAFECDFISVSHSVIRLPIACHLALSNQADCEMADFFFSFVKSVW